MAERTAASRRSASLRSRITLVSTGVVAVVLIVGAVLFGVLLRLALTEQLQAALTAQAESVADRLDEVGLSGIAADDFDDGFLQIVDESGAVVAASDEVEDLAAIVVPDDATFSEVRLPDEEDAFVVTAQESKGVSVVVGRSRETIDEPVTTVAALLGVVVPLLICLLAATVWVVVGRALGPVERLRREVGAIGGGSLDRRVAEPGNGDEIDRLAITMNAMLDRLERSQVAQRRFVSDASHELKSPLASLRQYAEVSQLHPDRLTAAELSDAILEEGARLERLVRGMLVLARADERTLEPGTGAVDLDDLVLAEARRIKSSSRLRVDTTGVTAVRVRGDRSMLEQVVRNLVDNAAMHADSRVMLAVGGDATLTIDDDGEGIPADMREKVFERFVRLDSARARDSGGSGIGLAIVRELVTAHGGSVVASESPLGGARFEVTLPSTLQD